MKWTKKWTSKIIFETDLYHIFTKANNLILHFLHFFRTSFRKHGNVEIDGKNSFYKLKSSYTEMSNAIYI